MRRVLAESIKEGMILARPVYTGNGVVLLKTGTKLDSSQIIKVVHQKIKYVYIDDEISKDINVPVIVSDDLVIETRSLVSKAIKKLSRGFDSFDKNIYQKIEAIVIDIINNKEVLLNLQSIRDKSDYCFSHSVNVCILSTLFAAKMGYSESKLRHLALGALLHDVGKALIEKKYHAFNLDFTPEEVRIYRSHVRLGYEIIKDMGIGSMLSANIALSHHERYDGTGFPFNKKGKDIHEYSRIVAVADQYDRLKYERPDLNNHEVMELTICKAYSELDPDIVRVFARTIAPYPIGSMVSLSTGEIGIIEKHNNNIASRPIVRIVDEEENKIVRTVDLSKELNIVIKGVVSFHEKNG